MKFQCGSARNQLHIGTHLMQQTGQVGCRRTTSDHNYIASPERFQVMMAEAVREKFWWQSRQVSGHMLEVRDAYSEHDSAGGEAFAAVESQAKAIWQTLQASDHLVFEFGHFSFLERETVGAEGVEAHRKAGVGVFDPLFRAKMVQRKITRRIINVRGEAVGFETHAFGHVRPPAIH